MGAIGEITRAVIPEDEDLFAVVTRDRDVVITVTVEVRSACVVWASVSFNGVCPKLRECARTVVSKDLQIV